MGGMMTLPENIIRGRMTEDEKNRVADWWEEHGNEKGALAKCMRHFRRHPSTIQWTLIKKGLWNRRKPEPGRDAMRGDVPVRRYRPEEDAVITRMELAGHKWTAIAAELTRLFPDRPRTPHSVQVRSVLLACYAEAEESEMEEAS